MTALRTVIVTGASRGIGLAIASTLAAEGFRVVAVARRSSEAFEAAAAAAPDGSMHFTACDLGKTEALQPLVRGIRAEHGPIYGLVNNAAIGTPGLLATMPDHAVADLVHLNTLAPMLLTKYVVRGMMASGSGRIVSVSSIIAFTGYNALSVYAATKASMIGFTRSLSREVGRLGVTVNAVAPGFIETALTEGMDEAERERIAKRSALRRLADPDDVANAVAYLFSDKARNVTGTVLTVDAGSTA
ncbi:SDR family NAD(P)-dependent oxidoreductase [Methylobacterium haplocladii]|uniref:3-oxoacyl-ACP reductase n=1 Tax=Methylobacterium haplocladii TaxID=1176176 RepID=A0A512IJB7_9HYPH|nr:SDR family oxidoreductase [Methylobacterium haplocladii]GEO97807.1 3-oxoacyl-ACP reductase [Methylobacterium haplocladii]GJD82653.1 3-oxoacyl-[acyl-carrier-protein] reductase FabG [Methylobacterium haplocladii]GLS57560.1 3-oxoacyl-ACP reductase [Methylobacterium haplocladii]